MRIVLLSGGIESALLIQRRDEDEALRALFIDYGQKNGAREGEASAALAARAGVGLERIDLAALGERFRKDQPQRLHVPIPHRNLLLASLAFSWAANVGATSVALGVNAEDGAHYASSSAAFVGHLRALCALLEPAIEVVAPLLTMTKTQVVGAAQAAGVPLALTWSCIRAQPRHCGRCLQCRKRREAFAAAGVAEPAEFYVSP